MGSREVELVLIESTDVRLALSVYTPTTALSILVFFVTRFEKLAIYLIVPLDELQIIADMFLAFLLFKLPLFLQVRPHNGVKVTVGFGAARNSCLRRAIGFLQHLFDGFGYRFYALDVSLALLQTKESISRTYP